LGELTESNKEISIIQKKGKQLAEIIGKVLGPVVGMAAAGPMGGIAGGVAASLIKFGLEEFMGRWLTPKEAMRVGTSAEFIIAQINGRLEKGDELNIKLFEKGNEETSEAEELFEGVLLKCKNEYQEKKLKYIANIFISSTFDNNISAITANQFLSVAEKLTYRKLGILAFYGKRNTEQYISSDIMIEPYSGYKDKKFFPDLEVLKQDIFELMNQGLVTNDETVTFTSDDIMLGKYTLTEIGLLYFNTMRLNEIGNEETDMIFEELKYRKELGLNEKGEANTGNYGT